MTRAAGSTSATAATSAEGHLGFSAARGAAITFVGQGARIVLQVAAVAVLARLLTPVDYGLVAMVLAVVGFGEIFRDFGLSTAAIQATALTHEQRDNLFWMNTLIGGCLAGVTVAAAPLVALLFHEPRLTAVTQVLAVTFLVNGLAAQYRADLNRRMRFTILVMSDVTAQLTGFGVATIVAVSGGGYWALATQQIVQVGTVLIFVVVAARWIPRLPHRGVVIRPFLRFGWHLMGSQLIGYASNNIDTIVVGLRFGPNILGIYNRAFQLLMRPLGQLRAPSTTVALPVLSRLNDDVARSGRYILKGQIGLGYTLVAGVAVAAGAADPIVRVFLGDQWMAVVPLFILLAVAGGFQTLSYVGYWVYLANGLTSDLLRYTLLTFIIKAVCILAGSNWGVIGVAAGYAVAPAIAWPISIWWLSRRATIPAAQIMRGAYRITACAVIAGGAAFAVADFTRGYGAVASLALAVASGTLAYGLVGAVSKSVRGDLVELLSIARKVVRR